MKDKPSLQFQRPLLLHSLQKHFEGADNIFSVHCGPPGHNIGVDKHLPVMESKHHQLDPAGLGLALERPRGPLFDPLLQLLPCLRGVVGHGRLVHGDDFVQVPLLLPLVAVNEGPTALDANIASNLGSQWVYFLLRPKSIISTFQMVCLDTA